jgi:hypothetical protein
MGRGRAKAKQQKVARELKYNSSHLTDLDALSRELGANAPDSNAPSTEWEDDEDDGESWVSATR